MRVSPCPDSHQSPIPNVRPSRGGAAGDDGGRPPPPPPPAVAVAVAVAVTAAVAAAATVAGARRLTRWLARTLVEEACHFLPPAWASAPLLPVHPRPHPTLQQQQELVRAATAVCLLSALRAGDVREAPKGGLVGGGGLGGATEDCNGRE